MGVHLEVLYPAALPERYPVLVRVVQDQAEEAEAAHTAEPEAAALAETTTTVQEEGAAATAAAAELQV
jgi:hypothetical protein